MLVHAPHCAAPEDAYWFSDRGAALRCCAVQCGGEGSCAVTAVGRAVVSVDAGPLARERDGFQRCCVVRPDGGVCYVAGAEGTRTLSCSACSHSAVLCCSHSGEFGPRKCCCGLPCCLHSVRHGTTELAVFQYPFPYLNIHCVALCGSASGTTTHFPSENPCTLDLIQCTSSVLSCEVAQQWRHDTIFHQPLARGKRSSAWCTVADESVTCWAAIEPDRNIVSCPVHMHSECYLTGECQLTAECHLTGGVSSHRGESPHRRVSTDRGLSPHRGVLPHGGVSPHMGV